MKLKEVIMMQQASKFMLTWVLAVALMTACTASAESGMETPTVPNSASSLTQPLTTLRVGTSAAYGASPENIDSTQALTMTPLPILENCPGDRLAFEKPGGDLATAGVYVVCLETGELAFAFGKQQYPVYGRSSDMSPDRNSILFVTDELLDKVVSFSLIDHSFKTVVGHAVGQQIEDVRWSPDGKFVGYIAHATSQYPTEISDHLEFLHIPTQTISKIETPFSSQFLLNIVEFQWSADGQRVMVLSIGPIGSDANGIFDMTFDCNNQTGVCMGKDARSHKNVGGEFSLSYDGSLVVGYDEDDEYPRGYIVISDLSDNTIRRIALHDLHPKLGFLSQPIFSPDATRVAFVARQLSTGITGIYVLDLNKMTLRNLTEGLDPGADFRLIAWR